MKYKKLRKIVKEQYNDGWIVINPDGQVYLYDEKPEIVFYNGAEWDQQCGILFIAESTDTKLNWEDSLRKIK